MRKSAHALKRRLVVAATAALGMSGCSAVDEAPAAGDPAPIAPELTTTGTEDDAVAPTPEAVEEPAAQEPAEAAEADPVPPQRLDQEAEDSPSPSRTHRSRRSSPAGRAPRPAPSPRPSARGAERQEEVTCGASCGADCGGVPGEEEAEAD